MQQEKYAIASFRSRSQVMKFAQAVKNAGVAAEIIPTPHKVALGCGLSLKFDIRDLEIVRSMQYQNRVQAFDGIYIIEKVGGKVRVIGSKSDFV